MDLMLQKCLDLRNRLENEAGQTMVEYDLLLTLIAVVVMAAVAVLGPGVSGMYTSLTGLLP